MNFTIEGYSDADGSTVLASVDGLSSQETAEKLLLDVMRQYSDVRHWAICNDENDYSATGAPPVYPVKGGENGEA